jgi:hypothetical protein
MVRCMVCSKIKRRDRLLVPKFGCFIKHLCLKKCYVARLEMIIGGYNVNPNKEHVKNEKLHSSIRHDTIVDLRHIFVKFGCEVCTPSLADITTIHYLLAKFLMEVLNFFLFAKIYFTKEKVKILTSPLSKNNTHSCFHSFFLPLSPCFCVCFMTMEDWEPFLFLIVLFS